ncbi:hypothetical protein [Kangiella sp. M94]
MNRKLTYLLLLFPEASFASDMGSPELWFFMSLAVGFLVSGLFYLIFGFIISLIGFKTENAVLAKVPLFFGFVAGFLSLVIYSEFSALSFGLFVGILLSSLVYYKIISKLMRSE